jgi:hypothetical protein
MVSRWRNITIQILGNSHKSPAPVSSSLRSVGNFSFFITSTISFPMTSGKRGHGTRGTSHRFKLPSFISKNHMLNETVPCP